MSKDAAESRLEEQDDVYADIFDHLILDSNGIITPESLTPMPTKSYTRRPDGKLRGGMRDIRKLCRGVGGLRLICGLENQTKIDNTMPERIMGYEYADYEEQVKTIMNDNLSRGRSAGASRIFKRQKLAPVLTAVLYYGDQEWKHPRSLYDMLEFPSGSEEILKKRVADYPMNLIQVAHLTKEERERLTSDFRIIAEYLACKNDPEQWQIFLKNTNEIRHPEELLDVLWELSGDERYEMLCNKIHENRKRKEKWSMCKIADYLENRGMERGFTSGMEQGFSSGMEQGLLSGMDTGILAMIRDNLDMGTSKDLILEKIIRYFSVSMERASSLYEQVAVE